MKIINIDWETDGQDVKLPTSMIIPDDTDKEQIADYLSDKTGWLVRSFEISNAYRRHSLYVGEHVFDVKEMKAGYITDIISCVSDPGNDIIEIRVDDAFNKKYMDIEAEMDSESWKANEDDVYQFAEGLIDHNGWPVCYEHDETEDNYPYYSPVANENMFSIEVYDEEKSQNDMHQ